MNLLLYSEFFYPLPGGTQSFVLQLARGLAESSAPENSAGSHSITLVTQTPGDSAQPDSYPFRAIRQPGFLELVRQIRHADLVHVAGPAMSPLALSVLLRKPLVVEHHGCQVACPNGLLFYEPLQAPCPGHYMAGRYGKCVACNRKAIGLAKSLRLLVLTPLRRWLCNRATANVMPTQWLAGVLKLKRMTTIHHGVANFEGQPATNSPASAATFAFQGRLVTAKGISTLLDAAGLLRKEGRNFRLKVIGGGPELESLRSRAAGLGAPVEFLGHIPENSLVQVLSDVATVIMPSLGGEVFGLVAAENMLRGKAVIVSDLGALAEVVGEAGLVFTAGDAPALAACMRRILNEPGLAASLGAAARARAQQLFPVKSMIDAHLALYRKSLA
ncbi:MAG TPA: glycosyltransferase family 4 protein [Candidatus Acidoferrales bacterium]|nr:glycosyltransferase family 4 protein [Candidatus Acidoferrales bacterium]